jgi:amino acid adenylation domain-containing protein
LSGVEPEVQQHPGFRPSPQQARLLALPGPDRIVRCEAVVASPDGVLDRLRASVERHEALRTTFVRPPGLRDALQAVHPWLEPSVTEQDLDLERGPVVRAALLPLPDGRGRLGLTAAAACADARSLLILLDELESGPTEGEPLQYAEYAAWRDELASSDESGAAAAQAEWREAGAASPLRSLLFGRTGSGSEPPATLRLTFDADALSRVDSAVAETHSTRSAFLAAAWHALLGRLAGEDDVVVATLDAARGHPELAAVVGPYSQPLAVRTRRETGTTFAELVDAAARAEAAAAAWGQHASSADLAACEGRPGFAYHEAARAVEELVQPDGPLRLELVAGPNGLTGALHSDPSAYDAIDTAEIADRYRVLLLDAAADPARQVAGLALLRDGERARLLPRPSPPAAPATVLRAFEAQVASEPARIAVEGDRSRLTYAELDEAASRLAGELRAQGAGSGSVVGLLLHRSPDALVAMLGTLKTGAAFLPLNFEHPRARLAHELAETAAAAVVTQEALLPRLPAFAGPVLCLDRTAAKPGAGQETTPGPDDLAYVIYTSGSTGLPKGVAVTHRGLAAYSAAMVDRLGVGGEPLRFAVVSALSTDLAYTALFPALASGGLVDLVPPETSLDPHALARHARERPADVLKIAPSHLRTLLAAGDPAVLPGRWLVLGGEPLSWELVEAIRALGAGCRILNHYGPTETTVGSCTFEVGTRLPETSTAPIGTSLPGESALVLDDLLEPVPDGVAGELCLGGAGLARGYVARPDETAERFVADPGGPAGARIYRTGDRARRLRDGNIELLGRLDDQLKLRGHRIEPGEVEARLRAHPALRDAAVAARPGPDGEPRLVAWIVSAEPPAAAELRAFLAETLPEPMLPALTVPVPALPLTASGKVDRAALPDPEAPTGEAYVAPRDELEAEIAAIWAELLAVPRIGVHDDFFALGGHSLLATQAVIRIRRRHEDAPLAALLAAPTVAAAAEAIRATEAA